MYSCITKLNYITSNRGKVTPAVKLISPNRKYLKNKNDANTFGGHGEPCS